MADKIILKRSSIFGKRPTNQVIQAGELALNTNAEDPGAFFQVSDGNVVKVGPTSVGVNAPTIFPEKGESWFDLGDGTLKIGSVEEAKKIWKTISAPFLGGGGNAVFVAPEFEYSTDNLRNDGQALPFRTVTRGILELSKIYISNVLSGFSKTGESNRYTLFLAPSLTTVFNDPGTSLDDFTVDFSSDTEKEVTFGELVQFNNPDGGLILPAGITISGMDLKKSVLSPSYVPSYRNPFLETGYEGVNEPISAIFRCSGNSYLTNFSVIDKLSFSEVTSVKNYETLALFETQRPHGLKFNDYVLISFNPEINQSTGTFAPGNYYAIPLNSYQFFLSTGSQDPLLGSKKPYVPFTDIPELTGVFGPKFTVEVGLKSAHRLRFASNVSLSELGDYYTKVQKAFADYFGGRVTNGQEIVASGDHIIVGPTDQPYPVNTSANTVKNSSFYANQVNLRSEYGMCWGDFDGSIVDGFKSVIANSCTAVSLQNDPSVYEIYTTIGNSDQKWWNLTQALYFSLPVEDRPPLISQIPVQAQLNLLNSTPINNIRYYYQNLEADVEGDAKNIGIVDIENDFRHFAFRVRNGAYAQLQSIYTIGAAIGVWALNGGTCNLTNSTTNFGSVSFKAEGFLGINTIGGANLHGKGFVFEGIQRPLSLTRSQTESNDNKKILSLGSRISNVYIDPADSYTQIIELSADFSPAFLLPYSLKPGTALWVETEDCTYRGFFATDGGPTVETGLDDPARYARLRIRASDSTIPNDTQLIPVLGVPYIRRFQDPRPDFDRAYTFYISNTSPTAIAPQVGNVLRLNQTSQQLGTTLIQPNVQFDPGVLGGWGRVFTVDAVETGVLGSSPQFNYVLADTNQDLSYYVALTVSDFSRPWTQGSPDGTYEFSCPYGTYVTHKYRNWYTAENNLWDYVYYGESSSFNTEFGPYTVAPFQKFSPFVDSSVLERQDSVSLTYQGGYAPDPYLDVYSEGDTYLRGATSPYPSYSTQDYYDGDDSSESLGICLSDIPDGISTVLVTDSVVVQTEQLPRLRVGNQPALRYRPAVIEFSVLSPVGIANPKQKVSVVCLTVKDPDTGEDYVGFVRVTNLNGSIVTGILLTFQNSSYPSLLSPGEGTNYVWGKRITQVTVCSTNPTPESELYDPYWTNTKRAVFRFFEIMGYSKEVMSPYLMPKYWGERLLPITVLSGILPENGYALTTGKWPLEFNEPSSIIANTHTWAYTGYYNYSRGLQKYLSTDITRKLASDFQAYTLWSGRLTVTGINDKGEIVLFGPQRQALTGNYYEPTLPTVNAGNQQIYEEQPYVEFPSQVIVYSADDISELFNGDKQRFSLKRGGFSIPPSQLNADSMIVSLGAVIQKPGESYTIEGNDIVFSPGPPAGAYCDIRIITSADEQNTLVAVPLTLKEAVNGSLTVFKANYLRDGAPVDLTYYDINAHNTFLTLGGVEQIPDAPGRNSYADSWAYKMERDPMDPTTLIITFFGAPPAGSTVDIRSICTAPSWGTRNIFPVAVYSLDSISGQFDGAKLVFNLTYNGLPVNAATVTQDNLIFSLGGAIQIPGVSYEVKGSQIIMLDSGDAPRPFTTSNIRVVTNAEFITCPDQGKYGANFVEWGPKLVLGLNEQSINTDLEITALEERVKKLEEQG